MNHATQPAFAVGQVVFLAVERSVTYREPERREAQAIAKVGRRWITLANKDRFEPETMELDPGEYGPSGRVFLTAQERDDFLERARLWSALQDHMRARYQPPQDLPVVDLAQACSLLGLNLAT